MSNESTPTKANSNHRGILSQDVLLSNYTSWRVGGPAKSLYQPADLDDLSLFLAEAPPENSLFILGAGTNVLARDDGFSGTVIVMLGALMALERQGETIIRAEAGVLSAKLAKMTIDLGLKGLEFLIGIPGSVGGALAMNAGAYGGSTWNSVVAVETIDRRGRRLTRTPELFEPGYRHIKRPTNEWFTAGIFKLEKSDPTELQQSAEKMLASRKAKHPLHLPNAGSVFRNPPGHIAAQLIEACGLKGYRVGGAAVSEKHANFIVNDQGASAKDIEAIIRYVQRTVEKQMGIELVPEIVMVGEG